MNGLDWERKVASLTLTSFLCNSELNCLATQPPCLLGELVLSAFSHPRLPLTSLCLSDGGSHSDTAWRYVFERNADPKSCAIAIQVWVEGSKSRGRYISKASSFG